MGVLHFFLSFFSANAINTPSFEKYVRIKIEDYKILILMSKLSPKLDKMSYPCKYSSILWDFYVFHCISLIYHIIRHSSEKDVRIKIEDQKIPFLMSKLSPKLDEVNASYPRKYNSILWDFHAFHCVSSVVFIVFH